MQGALLVGFAQRRERAVLLLEADTARHGDAQLAFGTLHFDCCGPDLHLHGRGYGNWFSSNS